MLRKPLKALREQIEAARLDCRSDVRAEFAVHCRPDLRIVLEGKRHGIDPSARHQGLHDCPGGRYELEGTRAKLRDHLALATQLIVWEHDDVDVASGLLLDLLTGL